MVASHAGEVCALNSTTNPKMTDFEGQFVKVKILLDTRKPVCPGVFLRRQNRKPVWLSFKYERLPTCCFKCGLLNHDIRNCPKIGNIKSSLYGLWLRAESASENIQLWSEDNKCANTWITNRHKRKELFLCRNHNIQMRFASFVSLPESLDRSLQHVDNKSTQTERVQDESTPLISALIRVHYSIQSLLEERRRLHKRFPKRGEDV